MTEIMELRLYYSTWIFGVKQTVSQNTAIIIEQKKGLNLNNIFYVACYHLLFFS